MRKSTETALAICAVALIALNLRPFLAGPGPVLHRIGAETGLTAAGLSLLSLGPLALIGLGAFLAPRIQNRIGARRAILIALACITGGSVARLVPTGEALIATAAVCGLGVALIQAVLPALIRERFPRRHGLVTSVYSASLLAGGALGAQAVPLIAQGWGWSVGLAAMALPAALALALTLAARSLDTAPGAPPGLSMWRVMGQRRSWHLIACFGALNASYATIITWIGPQFEARGIAPGHAGFLIAVMSVWQAVAALVLPPTLSAPHRRRGAILLSVALQAAGFVLLIAGAIPPLVTVSIMGVGLGGTFALMIVAVVDCTASRDEAVRLMAAVQGGGFALNALAPLLAALVMERTGGFWTVWALHLGLLVLAVPLVATMPRTPEGAKTPDGLHP